MSGTVISQDVPLEPGDSGTIAMLSLCAGGLIRTWTDSGSSRLWSVQEADFLREIQGTGLIGRTLREEGRFREVGMLFEESGTLVLQSRFPDPYGSKVWSPHIVAGRQTQNLSAPASPETIDIAPIVMMDAIATWGLQPWDLALTFGQH